MGGSTERATKLAEAASSRTQIREYVDSGRGRNILGQSDSSLACVSSGLKCWDLSVTLTSFPPFLPRNTQFCGGVPSF